MTNYRIIYPTENNSIAIIVPATGSTQNQVLQAVPAGSPYLIINIDDIPTDGTFRDAWTADFADAPIKE